MYPDFQKVEHDRSTLYLFWITANKAFAGIQLELKSCRDAIMCIFVRVEAHFSVSLSTFHSGGGTSKIGLKSNARIISAQVIFQGGRPRYVWKFSLFKEIEAGAHWLAKLIRPSRYKAKCEELDTNQYSLVAVHPGNRFRPFQVWVDYFRGFSDHRLGKVEVQRKSNICQV